MKGERPHTTQEIELMIREPMIDESLMAKIVSLNPADRLELIGAVWDTLSPNDLPLRSAP